MADRSSSIGQVSAITGCNEFQAGLVLERCNGDVERAVNSFFDDPPPERPTANSTTQGSSTAVVPFQGDSQSQTGASGWASSATQAYGPPPGPPPASSHGWRQDDKGILSPSPVRPRTSPSNEQAGLSDVIDLTQDAETDDDLRRAMAASLQDQQTYRPPAPSSTVGVSDSDTSPEGSSPGFEIRINGTGLPWTLQETNHLPNRSANQAIDMDIEGLVPPSQGRGPAAAHGYQLRDRSKLVRPASSIQLLEAASQCSKRARTTGRRGNPGYRGNRRAGRGRGGRGRRGWYMDMGMSEDEQLRQALEASVQSHQDLMQLSGSGARTPALPQHLETDLQSRRVAGAPVAMVAPFASLEVVAAIIQALFAAPPVRRAYLAARPADPHAADLSNFWKGAAPTDGTSEPVQPPLEPHFELAQRIQTLFQFAHLSQRPLCVIKNVTSLAPSEVIARGADHSPPVKVASLLYEYLVESFGKHVAAVSELILNTPGAEPVETDALWMDDSLFLSSGAPALTQPVSPRSQDSGPGQVAAPKTEQRRSFIQIRHDSVNSDTYSCLRAALASDGEGALLTRTARTISMGVDHAISTADGGPPPLTINERIHLDSLMWDRRQGMRLDAELRDLEMVRLDALRQELEARKRKLLGDAGRPCAEVLAGAKRYFDQVASSVPGADAVRSASLTEAAPQIAKLLEAVQADVSSTDRLVGKIRAQIDAKRAAVAEQARQEAANPEWTQLAYDLCAVLCHEGNRCVSFVKQPDATWWKVANGHAVQVEREDVVMGRPQDPSLSVFWVVYARAEEAEQSAETREAEEKLISETVKAAIADDNLTYESELLSLIRSDAATPSSTPEAAEVTAATTNGDADPSGAVGDEAQDVTMGVEPDRALRGESASQPTNAA